MTLIGWSESDVLGNEEKAVTFALYEQKYTAERHSNKAPEIFAKLESFYTVKI